MAKVTHSSSGQPVIPSKDLPRLELPPEGTKFYQITRDGQHWALWEIAMQPGGNLSCSKKFGPEIFNVINEKMVVCNANAMSEVLK